MSRANLADELCSCARTIAPFGASWTLMLPRELFLGSRRFDALQRHTGGSPLQIVRKGCGETVTLSMSCLACGEPMQAHDAKVQLSPEFEHQRRNAEKHR